MTYKFLFFIFTITPILLNGAEAFTTLNNPSRPIHETLFKDLHKPESEERYKMRSQMLNQVNHSWEQPIKKSNESILKEDDSSTKLQARLDNLIIPKITFTQTPLSHVVAMFSEISGALNPEKDSINIILIDPKNTDPKISINLKNISLSKALKYITQTTYFSYDIEDDIIVIRENEASSRNLETEFFPISRATVIRLTDLRDKIKQNESGKERPHILEEEQSLKNFLQRSGIDFINTEGSNLAFEGTQLIITQTPRNLKKVALILNRYREVKQVEIEAKFIEVQEGALEELGVRWNLAHKNSQFSTGSNNNDNLRSLSGTFATQSFSSGDGQIVVDGSSAVTISNTPPSIPNSINLANKGVDVGKIVGVLGSMDVNVLIRALEQHGTSDLMSAPKLTVLSGKTAQIIVAQELRFPQQFGDIRSEVGVSNQSNAASSGVSITTGTPKDFSVRNIGVEMEVTPTVEDDDSISLSLEPQVTEFEGFVEYGGNSVALNGNTTVNVPSGFFQPIFSTRKIKTEVTIDNGCTVVMGGLTREEAKQVHDKVPVLGDIPLLGRLFRSKGETSQKRNLLIFVTAKLVAKDGSNITRR